VGFFVGRRSKMPKNCMEVLDGIGCGGFVQAHEYIMKDKNLTSTAKLLFFKLSLMAGVNLICSPTNRELAQALNVSMITITNSLKILKNTRCIRVYYKGNMQSREIRLASFLFITEELIFGEGASR
jgi:transcriptional antiterminator